MPAAEQPGAEGSCGSTFPATLDENVLTVDSVVTFDSVGK